MRCDGRLAVLSAKVARDQDIARSSFWPSFWPGLKQIEK
jgi:hypothetical protein